MALKSTDDDLRYQALQALNWFGADAVPEMIPFMNDPHESIAIEAFNFIDNSMSMMDDESTKLKLIEVMTVGYVTQEEQVISLLSKLDDVKPRKAVQAIIAMMKKVEAGSLIDQHLKIEYEDVPVKSLSMKLWLVYGC